MCAVLDLSLLVSIIRPLLALTRFDSGLCGGAGGEVGWAFRGFSGRAVGGAVCKKEFSGA